MKTLSLFAAALLIAGPALAEQRGEQATERARQGLGNAGLTGKVKSALAADVGLRTLTAIDVDSDAGTVTLKGKVDSGELKRRAEQVAKGVDGVSSVRNQLSVEPKK